MLASSGTSWNGIVSGYYRPHSRPTFSAGGAVDAEQGSDLPTASEAISGGTYRFTAARQNEGMAPGQRPSHVPSQRWG